MVYGTQAETHWQNAAQRGFDCRDWCAARESHQVSRAAVAAVSGAKTRRGDPRTHEHAKPLAPAAFQAAQPLTDPDTGDLRPAAQIINVPVRASGALKMVAQASAQPAWPASAAEVKIITGRKIEAAQPAHQKGGGPIQLEAQGIAAR